MISQRAHISYWCIQQKCSALWDCSVFASLFLPPNMWMVKFSMTLILRGFFLLEAGNRELSGRSSPCCRHKCSHPSTLHLESHYGALALSLLCLVLSAVLPRSAQRWFSRALWARIPRTLRRSGRSTSFCASQEMFIDGRVSFRRTTTGWTGSCGLPPSRWDISKFASTEIGAFDIFPISGGVVHEQTPFFFFDSLTRAAPSFSLVKVSLLPHSSTWACLQEAF